MGMVEVDVFDLETENHHFAAGIGRLIVHNTDSCMIDLNIKDSKECQRWGELLSQEISGVKAGSKKPDSEEKHEVDIPGLFPPPLRMEFEKAMRLLCIKKKKYAALLIDKKGNFKRKKEDNSLVMLTKGIVLARRDITKSYDQFIPRFWI